MGNIIFVNYRREDSSGDTGRICDRLIKEFGKDAIFMDVDTIPLGVNFKKYLEKKVAECNALLVVIGIQWLNIANDTGIRRIDDCSDFVAIEIEAALNRDIPVIPVLVQNSSMPSEKDLPERLKALAYRHGISIRHEHFHSEMERLIQDLKKLFLPQKSVKTQTEKSPEFDRVAEGKRALPPQPENKMPKFLIHQDIDGKYYSRVSLVKRRYLEKLHEIILTIEPNAELNVSSSHISYSVKVPDGKKRINPLVTIRHTLESYFFPRGRSGRTFDRTLDKYDSEEKILYFEEHFFEEFEAKLKLARKQILEEYGI